MFLTLMLTGVVSLATGCIPTKVTYIGSAGYLLESPNKKVLIDAPFADFVKQFEVPIASAATQDNIANGIVPFNDIDLILISHSHPGHFDYTLIAGTMKANPDAKLVGTAAVYNILASTMDDFDLIADRIVVPALDIDHQTTNVTVDGIEIYVSRSPHWSRPGTTDEGYLYNYAFNLEGNEIVYALDQDQYVKRADIDILFGSTLTSSLEPKHIVLDHQNGYANIANLAEQTSTMPEVTFLPATMQKVLLIKHDDGSILEHDIGSVLLKYLQVK